MKSTKQHRGLQRLGPLKGISKRSFSSYSSSRPHPSSSSTCLALSSAQATPILGNAQEWTELGKWLTKGMYSASTRCVVLVGPSGVGKTFGAYTLLREHGFSIYECNSCDIACNAEAVARDLYEVCFRVDANKMMRSCSTASSKTSKGGAVLLDDIDVYPPHVQGAIVAFIKKHGGDSKCAPILCTCQQPSATPSLRQLCNHVASMRLFLKPPPREVLMHMGGLLMRRYDSSPPDSLAKKELQWLHDIVQARNKRGVDWTPYVSACHGDVRQLIIMMRMAAVDAMLSATTERGGDALKPAIVGMQRLLGPAPTNIFTITESIFYSFRQKSSLESIVNAEDEHRVIEMIHENAPAVLGKIATGPTTIMSTLDELVRLTELISFSDHALRTGPVRRYSPYASLLTAAGARLSAKTLSPTASAVPQSSRLPSLRFPNSLRARPEADQSSAQHAF